MSKLNNVYLPTCTGRHGNFIQKSVVYMSIQKQIFCCVSNKDPSGISA